MLGGKVLSIGRLLAACGIALLELNSPARAQQPRLQIQSFSVGPDTALTYPNNPADPGHLNYLPDEHTTFIPPAPGSSTYLVFGAAQIAGGNFGATVLETTDLKTFDFATGYNHQVLTSPLIIGKCNPTDNTEFDLNYAAPSSVLQDPTLPAGNLIMLYEAENHCPGGVTQGPFYATVGFARSSDNGKTWPAPVTGALGGPSRHPILQTSDPPPTAAHSYLGDAIPTGFIDKNTNGDYYLYVSYGHYSTEAGNPPRIGLARAKLGADPLTFLKWYNGAFSQPGIGGVDSDIVPAVAGGACTGRPQYHPEISYNDDLGLYLLIYWCGSGANGANVTWYYSTATSLDLQDWTAPQMIQNSAVATTTPCTDGTNGQQFDGWYPSSTSPGAAAGHTKLTGYFFSLSGCIPTTPTSVPPDRQFSSRTFTITTQAQVTPTLTSGSLANGATYLAGGLVPGSWAQVKGANLSNVTRIWGDSDFTGLGNKLPTILSGVQVMVNNLPAAVYYVDAGQVSFQVPAGVTGTASVQVIDNGVASNTLTATATSSAPGIFPVIVNGTNYPAGVFPDGTYVGDPKISSAFRNAKPGDAIQLYATGLVPTPAGVLPTAQTVGGVTVTIGSVTVPADFAGLVAVGEFPINFTVPQQFSSLQPGAYPISIQVGGVSSPATINSNPPGPLVLPIQH
ncbi:MAG TPA: IPT/TIG domain-containing protein [Bryobacteraceae bacterium]|nr:IPT/TIG domain-containing protein [Bryobacteraceae bacterium]